MKHRQAVSAVIVHRDKILCVRKSTGKHAYDSGKYEFPGGKLKKQEAQEKGLIREIEEELSMQVQPVRRLITVEHLYDNTLFMIHTWLCTSGNPQLELKEHTEFQWLEPDALHRLDWADAELPVVAELERLGVRGLAL